jgi:hypothetical protein
VMNNLALLLGLHNHLPYRLPLYEDARFA